MTKKRKLTDKQRLDFLMENSFRGLCVLNDDNDHWAVVSCFFQKTSSKDLTVTKVTDREKEAETRMEFIVPKQEWKNSLREAIDAYHQKCIDEGFDDGRQG